MNLFTRKPNSNEEGLEAQINKVLAEMQTVGTESPKYPAMLETLKELYKLKEVDYADKPKALSPDTVAIVVGNLIGIGILVGYEHGHVITSKTLAFIKNIPVRSTTV